MGIDTSEAGKLIAEQMEAIEDDYKDRDDCKVGVVVAIVEVSGDDGTEFRVRTNVANLMTAMGVMNAAQIQMMIGMARGNEAD